MRIKSILNTFRDDTPSQNELLKVLKPFTDIDISGLKRVPSTFRSAQELIKRIEESGLPTVSGGGLSRADQIRKPGLEKDIEDLNKEIKTLKGRLEIGNPEVLEDFFKRIESETERQNASRDQASSALDRNTEALNGFEGKVEQNVGLNSSITVNVEGLQDLAGNLQQQLKEQFIPLLEKALIDFANDNNLNAPRISSILPA